MNIPKLITTSKRLVRHWKKWTRTPDPMPPSEMLDTLAELDEALKEKPKGIRSNGNRCVYLRRLPKGASRFSL